MLRSDDDSPHDVVFVGGGVIGLSAAWFAARSGRTVAVVDPAPGRGATWAAAGMLAPVTEAHFEDPQLVEVLLEAARRWPAFAAELGDASGVDVGYLECGTLTVGADPSDRAAIARLLDYQHSLGLRASSRSAAECRAIVPALSPSISGGAEMPFDHQVDNRRLVEALLAACRSAGVAVIENEVTALCRQGERAGGVQLAGGTTLLAHRVVLCAGYQSGSLAGFPATSLPPVRPVKGQILRLSGPTEPRLLERTVRALVHGRSCYLVPRDDGSVVIGATVEERGDDRSVRAGPVLELLEDARTAVPGIEELELVECVAGLRPGSPDNAPIVGRTDIAGLLVATGHYRNGILQAPLTAATVLSLLDGSDPPAVMAPFGPDRFSTRPRAAAR